MRYVKPALTFEAQADQLILRGLLADRADLIATLKSISYYRLSAYWYPFRQANDHFQPGTDLETIRLRYNFDRRLRLLLLDGLERVEVALRTELVYRHAHAFGPFGYLEPSHLPNLSPDDHHMMIGRLQEDYLKSRERFVQHFTSKYGDEHDMPPLWMITELMTFGELLTMFRGLPTGVKQAMARRYGLADAVLQSWLLSLNAARNICAHHARLWNRELGYRPMLPRHDRKWQEPTPVRNDRVFALLSIVRVLLREIDPATRWGWNLRSLMSDHPQIPLISMGFPETWESGPLWREGET
jgi:abortive infection bacteriophage resistance protein